MKADFKTPECCPKQSIAVMDHRWPLFEEPHEIMVNRMCMNCYAHWAGLVGQVKQYSRKEWDALMADIYSLEKI